ncbi:MAG: low molecular weight phosphotyrosine protein phosphatase [Rhodospirillales bacterium]|nr:low molecular weight phosphotyrosine protein phosphatase [Rhodospirillales bacterium]
MNKYGVLFVCTGNICRSPTAEGVFRHYAAQQGLSGHLHIDSAGTHGYHVGEPPDSRAIAAALARGVDMNDLRARKFSPADYGDFDLILAMDSGHHNIITRQIPNDARAQVALFMDYAPQAGSRDVPDPYYGGTAEFEYALDLVEQGVQGLIDHVRQQVESHANS